jgi:hypothetical protein
MGVVTGMLIAGMALSAYSSYKQGKAAKAAGKAQRAVAEGSATLSEYNAAVSQLQAQDAVERGVEQEGRFRAQVRGVVGAQRAGFAGANIDVSSGSAADVQADAAFLGELDALTIRTNAAREAWGYQVQAVDLRERARISRKEGVAFERAGNAAGTAAYLSGAASLLNQGSTLATRYGWGTPNR